MISDISQSIAIRAAPARVWTVLTREGMVEQWLGCMDYKSAIGHVFYMQPDPAKRAAGDLSGATHCELLRLDSPHEMEFSWYYPDTPATIVTILLTETAEGTRIDLIHSGWDQFDPDQIRGVRDMLDGGWSSFVLPQFKRVAEDQ